MKFLAPVLAAALLLTPVIAEAKNDKGRGGGNQTQMQPSAPGLQQPQAPSRAGSTTKKNDPCKNLRAQEVRQNPACGNR